ncbi:MAG: PIN domain-containing protein [Candidatus Baldrarchaeia archaeon]
MSVKSKERIVFDTEAILAFYLGEEGGDVVRDYLKRVQAEEIEGYFNIVNLTEFYYILYRRDPKIAEEKEKELRLFGVTIVPIEDDEIWREAGKIKGKHALSLADAFAAATAKVLGGKLLTGSDEEFEGLDLEVIRIRKKKDS